MKSFYNKKQRYIRKVYSVTASADFYVKFPEGASAYSTPYVDMFVDGDNKGFGRHLWDPFSGSYINSPITYPRRIYFDVPDKGKIVDIKVWVELINDYRSSGYSAPSVPDHPATWVGLRDVMISLVSPNVSFTSCHPIENSEIVKGKLYDVLYDVLYPSNEAIFRLNNRQTYPGAFQSSYLLYQGGNILNDLNGYGNNLDIRTVFYDASPYSQPDHLEQFLPYASEESQGIAIGGKGVNNPLYTANSASSPTQILWNYEGYPTLGPDEYDATYGLWVPWFSSSIIPSNIFTGQDTTKLVVSASSVPTGWLNGPTGTADTNEWPTDGLQIGKPSMKPFYPMLDDIIVERKTVDTNYNTTFLLSAFPQLQEVPTDKKISGFRPGLRGTEVNGRWELLIGISESVDGTPDHFAQCGMWFRQARLEFIIDQGEEGSFNPQLERKYKVPSYVPKIRNGKQLRHITSGTAWWNSGINYVYSLYPEQYGRTIGITNNPDDTSFAVFSRITGSFEDMLKSEGTNVWENTNNSFINNKFGTPYIPLSSGSFETPTFNPFTQQDIDNSRNFMKNIIFQDINTQVDTTAVATLNRANYFISTADAAINKVNEIYSSGSS